MNYQSMEIKLKQIKSEEPEQIEIRCHEVNDCVREIVAFVKSRQGQLSGNMDGRQYEIPITDVLYVESVDNRTFIYTMKKSYETKQRVYELEETLKQKRFLRISKSTLLNLMKVKSIKPALNGRFSAVLSNGEEVIISRKYVPDLKNTLKGEV
ncbi:MAG: LytTR family DNA-binding domain-containing protein [Eubacteriales bacterium]|nr:LytTR family DNA-binding domain-containing protein [Eubacteriales bacterium]